MRGPMSRAFVSAAVMVTMLVALPASGGDGEVQGTLGGRVLATGGGRVLIFDGTGKTLWQHRGGNCSDCWMLPSGNVLFADGEVKEVTPGGEVVFHFRPKEKKGGGAYTCQRLEDGRTLIGENSTGRVLEVDREGKIVFELKTEPYKEGNHHNLRMVRKLPSGNYLVCLSGAKTVREYTPKGDVVLEIKVHTIAFSAVRLANGNTMVGYLDNVTEFDPGATRSGTSRRRTSPARGSGRCAASMPWRTGTSSSASTRRMTRKGGASARSRSRARRRSSGPTGTRSATAR